MYAKFEHNFPETFVVSEETIRKIIRLVQPHFREVALNATCNDQTFRGFENVDELASYPNARASRINILSVNGYEGKAKSLSDFSLCWAINENGPLSLVKVKISGDSVLVGSLQSAVMDTLEATKPWYWRISAFDIRQMHVVLLVIWLLFAGLEFLELTYDLFVSEDTTKMMVELSSMSWGVVLKVAWWLFVAAIGVIVVLELTLWIIVRPKRHLFPSGMFLIGAQKTRHENSEKFRLLYLGTILSALITIVVAVLW